MHPGQVTSLRVAAAGLKDHVQLNSGAPGIALNIHGVAELADHPEPVSVGRLGIGTDAADERIGDMTAVAHLADYFAGRGPDVQGAVPVRMTQGVSGEFADRNDQVPDAIDRKLGQRGLVTDELAHLGQIAAVGNRGSMIRRVA
jgi:hypothetical protein